MKKYIVLYHASKGAMEKMGAASPEDMKKGMEPWMVWAKRCGSGLVDMGSPLGNAQKVVKNGASSSQSTVNSAGNALTVNDVPSVDTEAPQYSNNMPRYRSLVEEASDSGA